jgi:hypothetical protein
MIKTTHRNQLGSDAQIKYMLERTSALLLSDVRKPNAYGTSRVSPASLRLDHNSIPIPFVPLLLGMNLIRLWTSGGRDLFSVLPESCSKDSDLRDGDCSFVDWEETYGRLLKGGQVPALRDPDSDIRKSDGELFCKVANEFALHLGQIQRKIDYFSLKGGGGFESLQRALAAVKDEFNSLRAGWEHLEERHDVGHAAQFQDVSDRYASLMNHEFSDFKTYYDDYLAVTGKWIDCDGEISEMAQKILTWRADYISLKTGLGPGGDILVKPTTDVPHLYELWCFSEFVNALARRDDCQVRQVCLLEGRQNLRVFSIAGGLIGDVFYNYRGGEDPHAQLKGRSLPATRVEWHIKRRDGSSIIIDTKYTPWNTGDDLTVKGYVVEFGASAGIVIFPTSIPAGNYPNYPEVTNGLPDRFGVHVGRYGKFFCLQLEPDLGSQNLNHQVIDSALSQLLLL